MSAQELNFNSNQFGLGSMGLAMASNLQRHLARKTAPSLIYSNRTISRGDPLKKLGGTPADNFSKLVSQCGIIFTMVCKQSIYLNSSGIFTRA